jgi:hypothetical protein
MSEIKVTPVSSPISTAAPVIEEDVNKSTSHTSEALTESLRNAENNKLQTQQEVATQEEKPTEEPVLEVKEEDQLLSPRFAALARKEKHLVEREKKTKEMEIKLQNFEKSIENIKKDPMAALQQIGMTFEELAQAYIASQDPEYVPTTEDKIKALEEKLSKKEQEELEAKKALETKTIEEEQKYLDEVVSNYKATIKAEVEANSEKYELIAANDAIDMVFEVVESYFADSGEVLDLQQALDSVESHLEEEAKKLLNLKKFAPKSVEPKSQIKDSINDVQDKSSVTLTNQNISLAASPKPTGLSREESLKRAASLIKWS